MPDANGNLKPGDPGYIAPNTGLLQTSTPDQSVIGYTPSTAVAEKPTAVGYDPKAFNVASNQTVQGQLKDIVAADSPLLQQAAARSRAAMNAKGLLNSSIAVGSGESAVIGAALPIAQQDAKTYETANINTVNAQNAAAAFKAGAENTAALRGAELGTNVNLANADAANIARREASAASNQILNTKLTTANQMAMAQLDAATKTNLTTMDNQYKQLLQTNQSAQSMFNQVVSNIANIAASSTMSAAAKDDATKSQLALLNEGLRTLAGVSSTLPQAVTNLNLSQYFQELGQTPSGSTPPPAQTPAPAAPAPISGSAQSDQAALRHGFQPIPGLMFDDSTTQALNNSIVAYQREEMRRIYGHSGRAF